MRYVAAYLLACLGGKENPTTGDIEKILSSVGIECDDEKVTKVINELKGKNIEEVVAKGKEKLASVPTGGGAAVAPAAAAAPAAASPTKAAEAKKEEKKEESDQSDDDMGFGLFD